MKNPKEKHTRNVVKQIHDVLWYDWDPIGINDSGPDNEYDYYIGGIYRILSGNPTESELMEYLYKIVTDTMGLSSHNKELQRPIAKKLMAIDVTMKEA
jgi:hypothetical protein